MSKTTASTVRKGQIIYLSSRGPVRVTKREKWNSTTVRVHFESAYYTGALPSYENLPLTRAIEVLTEDEAMSLLDAATAPSV